MTDRPTVTRATITRRAKALGVTVEFVKDRGTPFRADLYHEILLHAPAGHIFGGTQLHDNVVTGAANDPIESLYAAALDDLKYGVEPCTDPTCEVCHEEDPQ